MTTPMSDADVVVMTPFLAEAAREQCKHSNLMEPNLLRAALRDIAAGRTVVVGAAELAELRKDKARLDWIEDQIIGLRHSGKLAYLPPDEIAADRDAIDREMADNDPAES